MHCLFFFFATFSPGICCYCPPAVWVYYCGLLACIIFWIVTINMRMVWECEAIKPSSSIDSNKHPFSIWNVPNQVDIELGALLHCVLTKSIVRCQWFGQLRKFNHFNLYHFRQDPTLSGWIATIICVGIIEVWRVMKPKISWKAVNYLHGAFFYYKHFYSISEFMEEFHLKLFMSLEASMK